MSNIRQPLYGDAAIAARDQLRKHNDLQVAMSVAREMLAAYGSTDYADHAAVAQAFGATRESLRILLRALDAEPLTEDEKARRFVDRHFPQVAAFLRTEAEAGR